MVSSSSNAVAQQENTVGVHGWVMRTCACILLNLLLSAWQNLHFIVVTRNARVIVKRSLTNIFLILLDQTQGSRYVVLLTNIFLLEQVQRGHSLDLHGG
jgi:ascorbate-specific PTS system EIIC-type component UlaA